MKIEDIIDKNISVKCFTRDEYILFLKATEKTGMKWYSGERPTQHYEYWENQPIYIECSRDKANNDIILWDARFSYDRTIVKFSDLDLSDCYNVEFGKEKDIFHKMELKWYGYSYGIVGDLTEIEAYGHIKLFVGDVVELFDDKGESLGLRCVFKKSSYSHAFVTGAAFIRFINGQGSYECKNWLIIKRKSYTEMNVGDVVDDVEYKLT